VGSLVAAICIHGVFVEKCSSRGWQVDRTNVREKVLEALSNISALHARRNLAPTLDDKESCMIEPMTREEAEEEMAEFIATLRRTYPPQHIESVAPPINLEELRECNPGPPYEGFLEDIKRMRRGIQPLGPRR
jgi:hypothetical protein